MFGIQAARLAYKASYQIKSEQDELRAWYSAKWQSIKSSSWLQLPEGVVKWLVHLRDTSNRPHDQYWVLMITLFTLPLLILGTLWIHSNQSGVATVSVLPHGVGLCIVAFILFLTSLFCAMFVHRRIYVPFMVILTALGVFTCLFYKLGRDHREAIIFSIVSAWMLTVMLDLLAHFPVSKSSELPPRVGSLLALLCVGEMSVSLPLPKAWLDILINVSIGKAVLMSLFLLPLTGLVLTFVPAWVASAAVRIKVRDLPNAEITVSRVETAVVLFGFSGAISFTITLSALFLGHLLEPSAFLPQNIRMLLSNAICDGATVVASLSTLERAVGPKKRLSIPAAIFLNLLLALTFACASLWLGVKDVTLVNVVRVLIGHSIDGGHWEFGPYFWAMHTVFLPLLIYCLIVMLCWAAKATVTYKEWFYGRAAQPEINGLTMAARFLGYIATLLAAAATLLRFFV